MPQAVTLSAPGYTRAGATASTWGRIDGLHMGRGGGYRRMISVFGTMHIVHGPAFPYSQLIPWAQTAQTVSAVIPSTRGPVVETEGHRWAGSGMVVHSVVICWATGYDSRRAWLYSGRSGGLPSYGPGRSTSNWSNFPLLVRRRRRCARRSQRDFSSQCVYFDVKASRALFL